MSCAHKITPIGIFHLGIKKIYFSLKQTVKENRVKLNYKIAWLNEDIKTAQKIKTGILS